MPWYLIPTQAQFGLFTLHPLVIGTPNPNIATVQNDAEAILACYLERPFTSTDVQNRRGELPVRRATIITSAAPQLTASDLVALQYISALCGIADRTFSNSLYLCSENLHITVQPYKSPIVRPFTPTVGTRTKTGNAGRVFTAGLFREAKPWHVAQQQINGNPTFNLHFDSTLAQTLWAFHSSQGPRKAHWDRHLFPSLFSFYFANTDGLTEQIECVYSHTAIERLLLGPRHKENVLVTTALALFQSKGIHFSAFQNTTRNWQTITFHQNSQVVQSQSIFEAWLREFTRLRNCFAHGNYSNFGPQVWTVSEHLLLSAYVFPLLLKLILESFDPQSTYRLSRFCWNQLELLEVLLAESNYHGPCTRNPGATRLGSIVRDARLRP
jgi:hypothetical protein